MPETREKIIDYAIDLAKKQGAAFVIMGLALYFFYSKFEEGYESLKQDNRRQAIEIQELRLSILKLSTENSELRAKLSLYLTMRIKDN